MKILFLNHNLEDLGTYFRCFDLAKNLVKLGHEVTLICANKDPIKDVTTKNVEGVELILLPRLDWGSSVKRFIDNILRGFKAIGAFRRDEWDVIHTFAVAVPATAIPAIWCRLFKKTPLFVDWDDWWGRGGIAKEWGEPVHSIMTLFEEKVPKMAGLVTVTNECLNQRALDIGVPSNKIYKIPNGGRPERIKIVPINEAKMRLGLNVEEKIVLFEGGSLIPIDAIVLLIKSFKEVIRTKRDTKLIFLGKNIPETESIAKKYGIENETIFTGFVSEEEFTLYMEAADVLAFPLANINMEKGRWPTRFGDYLAAKRPIVATDIGEVGFVIKHNECGLVASIDDYKDFAEKTITLLDDKELADELANNARNFAEENDWMKIAKDMEYIYMGQIPNNCGGVS